MDILILCTGNICRSPMAEALLRERLAVHGVDARVSSAGLLQAGRPAAEPGIEVMAERGLDLTAHRSRTMTPAMLAEADLIVGMAREHVREAAVMAPARWPRAFTLKELVRRGEAAGTRWSDEPFPEWLATVAKGRRIAELAGSSPDDDVADPIGRPRSVYERVAAELDGLVDRLVAVAFAGALTAR